MKRELSPVPWRSRAQFLLAGCLLAVAIPGHAEVINMTTDYPAKFPEAALLRTLAINPFGGNIGGEARNYIESRLVGVQKDGVPFFVVVDSVGAQRRSGFGSVSGSATLNITRSPYQNRGTRCVRGKVFGKCEQSVSYVENCIREIHQATVNVSMTRASDRKLVYSVVKPVRAERSWCDGDATGDNAETLLLSMLEQAARGIERDVAPYQEVYRIRLLERTNGLTKPAVKPFKAAVKISTRDFPGSCAAWQQLAASGEQAAALSFNLGLCSEVAKDFVAASRWYDSAQTLSEGDDKDVADATARVRTLVAAQQATQVQQTRRVQAVAAERQQEATIARDARNAEQAAKRQAAQAAAAEARAEKEEAAVANAAREKRRQAVVQQHGEAAADAILAGNVQKGMTMAQVRAAVGAPQKTQRIADGEEQWFYPNRRVVFSGGRVTFVR